MVSGYSQRDLQGHKSSSSAEGLPGIRHIIAIGSGKGGVGKSTVAVNLALALNGIGSRVGLVDADILGPSIPGMLGLATGEPPQATKDGMIIPSKCYGLQVVSMGLLTGDDAPAVLRGPMVSKYLQMFIGSVQWQPLDYLILDLPPGTGDTQLTLAQSFPLSGVVIVTTPQNVSLKIARRGLRMFEMLQVPILGIIENMSTFTCPHCGNATDVFRRGGGESMSRELGVPFLGAIPLDADIVTSSDNGHPIIIDQPNTVAAHAYLAIAKELVSEFEELKGVTLRPFMWNWKTNEGKTAWVESAIHAGGSPTTPIGFRNLDGSTLSVLWEDGKQDDFDVRNLRLACRCALCIEEMSGRPLLDPNSVLINVAPRMISSVGNYAIRINWNDGHSSGIYSFTHLRAMGDAANQHTT
ncbi:MAG: P-loop NTPase [Gammaproteobacteria bacterium]|nr:P-loop NTPase [Gammaproteobacteria bacterium]